MSEKKTEQVYDELEELLNEACRKLELIIEELQRIQEYERRND
jgi:hypothetical protein